MGGSPIPGNWDVPQVFRDRFGARAGRQRVMAVDGHVLVILHELPAKAGNDDGPVARLYWRKPDGTWRTQGSSGTTIAPLRAHVEAFATEIDALEAAAAKATRAKDWFQIMHRAAPLSRIVHAQSVALQDAREAVKGDRDLIAVRDAAQDNERAIELINLHARSGLDYTIAASAEENARSTQHVADAQHRLNLIAATFLPISAIGGLFGINMVHGLERWNAPYAFWLVAATSLLVGFVVRLSIAVRQPS